MKKLLSAVLMCSFLTFALPAKKAEAGFMILAATQEFVWQHKYETLDTVLVIALPVCLITTSIFAVGIAGDPFNNFTLYAGAVLLDQTPSKHIGEIEASLASMYPVLAADEEVLAKLSNLIVAKYPSAKDKNGNALVGLTNEEIATATKALDLSDAELAELSTLN